MPIRTHLLRCVCALQPHRDASSACRGGCPECVTPCPTSHRHIGLVALGCGRLPACASAWVPKLKTPDDASTLPLGRRDGSGQASSQGQRRGAGRRASVAATRTSANLSEEMLKDAHVTRLAT